MHAEKQVLFWSPGVRELGEIRREERKCEPLREPGRKPVEVVADGAASTKRRNGGEEEPPTVHEAPSNGDEFARLLVEVHGLRTTTAESVRSEQELRSRLERALKHIAALKRENQYLLASLEQATQERN